MSNYFFDCPDLKAGKKKYAELAKKLHPDKGGSTEEMQKLNAEWERFQKEAESKDPFDNAFSRFRSKYDEAFFSQKSNPFRQEDKTAGFIETIGRLNQQIRNLEVSCAMLTNTCNVKDHEIHNLQKHLLEANKTIKTLSQENEELKKNSLLSDERLWRFLCCALGFGMSMLIWKLFTS